MVVSFGRTAEQLERNHGAVILSLLTSIFRFDRYSEQLVPWKTDLRSLRVSSVSLKKVVRGRHIPKLFTEWPLAFDVGVKP